MPFANLKNDKRDGLQDFYSNHITNASGRMYILLKYSAFLATSSLQFAFKKHHSTVLCTAILLETVSYFKERNSNVYSCLFDASNAFDRINHGELFRLLLQRGMPPLIVRFF